MKEATGELNMTVIVIVAIAAILTLFWVFVRPAIEANIKAGACKSFADKDGKQYEYKENAGKKYCCPQGTTSDYDTKCNIIETTT